MILMVIIINGDYSFYFYCIFFYKFSLMLRTLNILKSFSFQYNQIRHNKYMLVATETILEVFCENINHGNCIINNTVHCSINSVVLLVVYYLKQCNAYFCMWSIFPVSALLILT